MNTKHERQLQLEGTAADVAARLKRWAQATGFVCTSESPKRWLFHRGSNWKALYTFDIRKVPTDVEVSIQTESSLSAHCVWHTHSPLTLTTPGDPDRISEQLDLLVAHLRGAL